MRFWRYLAGLALGLCATVVLAGAPDIPLLDLDGKPRNVNEFIGRGHWVVVAVWASDCAVCAREIHEMTAFHNTPVPKGAAVLGVSIDGRERLAEARAFVRQHRLPFVNLVAEPDREVLLKFGAGRFVGTPTYYIYNPQGRIVGENVGPVTRAEVESFIASDDNARP